MLRELDLDFGELEGMGTLVVRDEANQRIYGYMYNPKTKKWYNGQLAAEIVYKSNCGYTKAQFEQVFPGAGLPWSRTEEQLLH